VTHEKVSGVLLGFPALLASPARACGAARAGSGAEVVVAAAAMLVRVLYVPFL
jgi:hypothetical protein